MTPKKLNKMIVKKGGVFNVLDMSLGDLTSHHKDLSQRLKKQSLGLQKNQQNGWQSTDGIEQAIIDLTKTLGVVEMLSASG